MKKTMEDLLIVYIKNKNISEAKKLIDSGVNIHYLNDLALALIASLGLDELFNYLLEHDANPLSVKSRTLKITSQKGQIDLVEVLLNKGLNRKIAEENANEKTLSFLSRKDLKDKLENKLPIKNTKKIDKI